MNYDQALFWKRFIYRKFGFTPFRASMFASEARLDVNMAIDLLEELVREGVIDKCETRHGVWYSIGELKEYER